VKIVHVIPGLTHERGGPSTVVQALASRQAAAGHEVIVLGTDQGARHGERPFELPPPVAVGRAAIWGPDRLAYAPAFAALARHHVRGSDVVHVHSIFTHPVHAALRAAAAAGVPVVLRPCGHLHRYSLRRSWVQKRLYLALFGGFVRRACAAWHYTSEPESAGSWPGDDSPRFVLPNGIDPDEYAADRADARAAVARAWPALGDAPYILFLGRLHPKKRLDLLLEAFCAGAPPACKLVVAGPDECGLWESLRGRFLKDAAAAARVVRLGAVSGRDKVALLAAAALFALPSEHENFGNAPLEALAAGTPVLLSPHVDLAGAAEEAGVGFVCPLRPDAWGESLARLLAQPERLEALSAPARAWVRERFHWDRIVGELFRAYDWVRRGCPGVKVCPANQPAF
jgi:glycosyltransferase involved in cell wall biosynthesis